MAAHCHANNHDLIYGSDSSSSYGGTAVPGSVQHWLAQLAQGSYSAVMYSGQNQAHSTLNAYQGIYGWERV